MAARPATSRSQERTDAPLRPAVRDLSRGGATFAIDWDVRTVYDFVFSLSGDAGTTDDLPAADRRWLTLAKAALPADIQASVKDLFESELCVHSATLVVDRPEVRTSKDLVAALAEAEPVRVVRAMFDEKVQDPELGVLIDDALAGDEAAFAALDDKLPDWHRADRIRLLRDPSGTTERLLTVLSAWSEAFGEIEPRIMEILVRDYDLRAGDRDSLAPTDLIEKATGGIRWLPEPGVKRVIMAPSYFSRPYNFLMSGSGWRFFAYPVSDEALEPSDALAAPQAVVRLHRALGDETRLKILKLLASRDLYLTEIAQQLELSKPTIKHHLAMLRSAGLVTITESGTVLYYSLKRNRLDDASAEIKRFLIGH